MAQAVIHPPIVKSLPDGHGQTAGPELFSTQFVPHAPRQPLDFDIVRDLSTLDEFKDDWVSLFDAHGRSDQVFQTYSWVRQWCEHFIDESGQCHRTSLHIVTARRGGVLIMVMPLVRICTHGQCRIEWLGHPVSQYGDVLIASLPDAEEIISRAFDHLVGEAGGDIIILRKVRAESLAARVLREKNPTVTSGDIAPAVTLPADTLFDEFQQRYTAKARKNRRRHRRRLSEQGDITFEVLTQGPEAIALIEQALAFKRAWLASRKLVSMAFADARIDGFFSSLPDDLAMCGNGQCQLHVYVLRCDGEPVAINVAFKSGDRLLTHIASYDLAYEKFSPGSLLFEQAIAHSLENGIAVFDLMSPGDAYKLDWTDVIVDVHDYAFGLTTRGKAYEAVYIRHLRPAMKQAAIRLPHLVRPLTRLLSH